MVNPVAQKILEGLNPKQREAVEAIDGPLLIIAGPGSPRAAGAAKLAAEWNAYALGAGRRAASCRSKA